MKCLHIANDFSLTKVHKNLYSHFDNLGVEQIIFNPVRNNTPVGNNNILFRTQNSQIVYSKTMDKNHRFFFRKKIKFLFNNLKSKVDFSCVDIVHATTLFSDGAIALEIYRKYNIPYIVAVRGTDVSLFLKYRPDLLFVLKDILLNASKIVFLGQALKDRFLSNPLVKLLGIQLHYKITVISNGIDEFWLSGITQKKKILLPNKILYIGRFDSNKNTVALIDAALKLKNEYSDLKLELVGSGGGNEQEVIELVNSHKEFITYYGPIYEKEELRKVYLTNHIFAMPSHSETFGLVYLEALSLGLPILCSINQGVYGTFESKIGEFVNPKSTDSIYKGLKRIISDYNSYELEKIDFSAFSWSSIAKTYLEIYSYIIRK